METNPRDKKDLNNKGPLPVTVFYKPRIARNIVHEILSDSSESDNDLNIQENANSSASACRVSEKTFGKKNI